MSYEQTIELLPSSIYDFSETSNIRKLWNLMSQELDFLESKIQNWYDKDNLSGEALDRLGLLKGIPRNGLNDADYRYELSLPKTLEIVTIPAVLEVLSQFGSKYLVRELHSSTEFEFSTLDGIQLLDATWNLFPNLEPKVLSRLDSTWFLNAEEPLEPYGVRTLGLRITLETDLSYDFTKCPKEIESLLAGISVYYDFKVIISKNLDMNSFNSYLDGSFLLDGNSLLQNLVEAVFYDDNAELYRTEVLILSDKIKFKTLKRTHLITSFKVLKSGNTILEQELRINTSIYLQYEFIIT